MISVCMATHNGARYIKEQIDSILPQLAEGDELIVSDDGSKDDTIEIIEQYADPRIKVFRYQHPVKFTDHFATHRYASRNFENAMSHAKGDIVFLCDQDDVWTSDKVAKCVEALKDAILVKHNGIRIDSESLSRESEAQPSKQPSPMRFTLSGSVTEVKEGHDEKASSSISSTPKRPSILE